MHSPRLVARAAALLLALAVVAGTAAASPARPAASPFTYGALGDSFSSGEGVAPYLRGGAAPAAGAQEAPANGCDRSTRAYSTWVRPSGFDATIYALASGGGAPGAGNRYGSDRNVRSAGKVAWAFWACSGATTSDVLSQVDDAYLSAADLVTLTIGGNDAGYVEVLVACGLSNCNTPAFRRRVTARIDAAGPRLEGVYRAVAARAPHARILVLGYAQPFPADRTEQSCIGLRLFAGEQTMLRGLGAHLNGTIAKAVAKVASSGADIRFVPVAARFAGHEVCGRNGAWISGIIPSRVGFGLDPGSFHPNLRGQRDGYGAAVNAVLG
jgi:lysophospholipase L1-like esterase